MRSKYPFFTLVDVFGTGVYSGNPLPVVFDRGELTEAQMLRITQEFRQFETIFVSATHDASRWHARVFDLLEELPFAGHPLLGAAAAICAREDSPHNRRIEFNLAGRVVYVDVEPVEHGFFAWLDAGAPSYMEVAPNDIAELLSRFGLAEPDMFPDACAAVMSTGLSYVVLPVSSNAIARACIDQDISELVRRLGAQFAVLVDPERREIRHWNNDGLLEDVATGSAASVVGAYLVARRHASSDETIELAQGRFAGRPSALRVRVDAVDGKPTGVHVGGRVHLVAAGQLFTTP